MWKIKNKDPYAQEMVDGRKDKHTNEYNPKQRLEL